MNFIKTKKEYFCGYYFKHQKFGSTVSLIPGMAGKKRFIQVITNDFSGNFPYLHGNTFTKKGVIVSIDSKEFSISGKVEYNNLTPIKYDIMGPFKFFSMECSHGIKSMFHDLSGGFKINGSYIDFTGGQGYIEKDSGTSFPKSYMWLQSNDFADSASISVSIADIPFFKRTFTGCICVIWYKGKEYRIATYLGGEVGVCNEKQIVLYQKNTLFIIDIEPSCKSHPLAAPNMGKMTRTIRESLSCKARFRLYSDTKPVFDMTSNHCSFEHVK